MRTIRNILAITISLFTCTNARTQVVTTIAGNATAGYSGDGGIATSAQLNTPIGLCFDPQGNMYIAEYNNNTIRKVDAVTHYISTVAGNGTAGFSGDGGPATSAQLNTPTWVVADHQNHLFITDYNNRRVRCVDLTTGLITTVAGNGTTICVSGSQATQTGLIPNGLVIDPQGNLIVSQHNPPLVDINDGNRISRIDLSTGIITHIAGNGQYTFAGDGGPALQASLFDPEGMAFDGAGNLYFADKSNERIRKINMTTGIITTIAGTGTGLSGPDGGQASQTGLKNPSDVKIDSSGNLIFADQNDCRIRKIDMSTGIITTIAGNTYVGMGPDCVPPTTSSLGDSRAVAIDAAGHVCWTEQTNNRIRAVLAASSASVTITPSATDVCQHPVITFTATTSPAGINVSYQWKKNGVNAGSNSATYTDTFKRSDVVTCAINVTSGCVLGNVTSSAYTLTGTNPAPPAITVAASATDVCPGTAITFTAANASNSIFPHYQWYVNNQPVGADTTVYALNTFTDSAIVQCKMTIPMCDGGTTKAYSTPLTVYTHSTLHPSITISTGSTTVCKGRDVSFSAHAAQTGAHPTWQWLVNGQAAGTSDSSFHTSALADGDIVTCTVHTDAADPCSPVQTAQSNQLVMHVQSPINPSLQITASKTEFCEGDSVQFHALAQDAGTAPQLAWQVNGATVSTNNDFAAVHLANGDQVTAALYTQGCTLSPMVTSNTLILTIHPLPVIDLQPADTTVAIGTAVRLRASVTGNITAQSWLPTYLISDPTSLQPLTLPLQQSTRFTLQIVTPYGCKATAASVVKVMTQLYMPSAFTPNGDGRNDVFRIPPGVNLKLTEFAVFDRWGNKLFSTKDITQGWGGTANGKPLSTGTYVYIVTGSGDKGAVEVHGTVELVR